MFANQKLVLLFGAVCSCLVTAFGVPTPLRGPLQNHITGGFRRASFRNNFDVADCSQFSDDYDILYQFPFQIMINPMNSDWSDSIAEMDANADFVISLNLHNEDAVPLSIFCLKNLQDLNVRNMDFPNGIVPDTLRNLRKLRTLSIYNSSIFNMTGRLGTLSSLNALHLQNCELTALPDLSGISYLYNVDFSNNKLSKIDGLTSVYNLNLMNNLFTDIPSLKTPEHLQWLYMDNNPVKNILAITSHTNLYYLSLSNTNLTSIAPTIDRLQNLRYLYLSNNKLNHLPTNILNLRKLRYLHIQNNKFSSSDIQTFQQRFNATNSSVTLYV